MFKDTPADKTMYFAAYSQTAESPLTLTLSPFGAREVVGVSAALLILGILLTFCSS